MTKDLSLVVDTIIIEISDSQYEEMKYDSYPNPNGNRKRKGT
jgi:hypothetical protein